MPPQTHSQTQTKKAVTFHPHDAHPYSGPEPTVTPQSHVPHQWYLTSEIPQTTISAGTCFGPDKTGLYLATRVNSFFSTGGDLNMQVTGVTNMDLVGDWLINVTGATAMTTPSTIDINAAQTITIVSGVGEPAALFPNHPGNEGGDPGLGGTDGVDGHTPKGRSGGNNTEKGKAENWGHAAEPLESPVSKTELIERLVARLIALGVGMYHLFAAHPFAGKFAGAAVAGAAAVGASVGIAAFAKSQADLPALTEAQVEADKLPPHETHAGERAEKGAPDIDLTAYANIVGKAKTGISWYTPKAIRNTADVAIVNASPVIEHHADKVLHNSAGDFIWNQAGMEIKNEAISIVTSGTVVGSSALVVNSMMGAVAASVTGLIAASMTGVIAASVTGLALAELSSWGIVEIDAGILMTQTAGAIMNVEAPVYSSKTVEMTQTGVNYSGTWVSMNTMAASVKTEAVQWSLTCVMATIKGAEILIG